MSESISVYELGNAGIAIVEAELVKAQAELTALREKLAAAKQQIEGKQAVIEASKAAINGQVKDCLKVEDDYADFRAAVRDALAELRAEAVTHKEYTATIAQWSPTERNVAWNTCVEITNRIDAAIAKLGLAEAAPAACTWTPDDDGNYATGCDNLFVIIDGTPSENQMAFCPYCGKRITEQPQ